MLMLDGWAAHLSRIWDINDKYKQKQVIVVKSKERGARTRVTACAWSSDGKYIAGGGSLNCPRIEADKRCSLPGWRCTRLGLD